MPRRSDISTILIIGSGPIVIGQGCEFDYSGVQACKALKEEGYRVVLINSNPATIMTDPHLADATYVELLTADVVQKIIDIEKVDAILPTMGGQTALNLAMELHHSGFLKRKGVHILGACPETIEKAENRFEFYKLMEQQGLACPQGFKVSTFKEAQEKIDSLSFPVIIRSSFTLGGEGSGFAHTLEEFEKIVAHALNVSPTHQAFIEESVYGWKEFELEVMRDKRDNCVVVCSIENIDPMGVHTGDSITVAPALTLTDKEYQTMRDAAFKVMRATEIETGGANVQFAVHPKTGRMLVIEMNPRVSRSSALASKATGFPIAKIAAKLAVGYTLDEIPNEITQKNSAAFEPSIDYIVTKIPRFDFEKFRDVTPTLTTSMQSVGEVMAIGRTFKESFQKAIRSLEKNFFGFEDIKFPTEDPLEKRKILEERLKTPHPEQYLYVAEAYRQGLSTETIHQLCHWDPWFLEQIQEIVICEKKIQEQSSHLCPDLLRHAKTIGFSNQRLSHLSGLSVETLRAKQKKWKIHPVYRRVDTCAAEFFSPTPYFYSTYLPYPSSEDACEASPSERQKVILLGSGPNHIGQGIEFDYCCVHAAAAAKELGYEVIMINCNPETVSTDHTTSDRLYFSPLTNEDILDIIACESQKGKVIGAFVQFGGQTSLKLARALHNAGITILGTSLESIDIAEDRQRCRQLMSTEGLLQPKNEVAQTPEELFEKSQHLDFPIILRPSYVIGGKAMDIIHTPAELEHSPLYKKFSEFQPILMEEFLEEAIEVEVDAISDGQEVYIAAITENFEKAGIHSGDSTSLLPSLSLSEELLSQLEAQTRKLARKLNVKGLLNIQFAIKNDLIYVLEINPRASRTIPFAAKATGTPLVLIAAQVMLGKPLASFKLGSHFVMEGVAMKKPIFSFDRLPGVEPSLGPEMKSTGEIMLHGEDFEDISLKLYGDTCFTAQGSAETILIIADRNSIHYCRDIVKKTANWALNYYPNIVIENGEIIKNTGFTKNAMRYISQKTVKCVIHLGKETDEYANVQKLIWKHKIPLLETRMDIALLMHRLNSKRETSSLLSLQERKIQDITQQEYPLRA